MGGGRGSWRSPNGAESREAPTLTFVQVFSGWQNRGGLKLDMFHRSFCPTSSNFLFFCEHCAFFVTLLFRLPFQGRGPRRRHFFHPPYQILIEPVVSADVVGGAFDAVVSDADSTAPAVASAEPAAPVVAFAEAAVSVIVAAPPGPLLLLSLLLLMLQLLPGPWDILLGRRVCSLWPSPHDLPSITEVLGRTVRFLYHLCFRLRL